MSTELVTIEPSANLTEAVHAMSAGRSGSGLVLQAGSLVGIFTERDILRALAQSAKADLARISSVTQWTSRDPGSCWGWCAAEPEGCWPRGWLTPLRTRDHLRHRLGGSVSPSRRIAWTSCS